MACDKCHKLCSNEDQFLPILDGYVELATELSTITFCEWIWQVVFMIAYA